MPSRKPDVTTDRWALLGQWPPVPEDVTRCAERLLRFLEGIGRFHSGLRQWYWSGEPVTLEQAALTALLRNSLNPQFAEHGWKTAIWNGVPDPPGQSTLSVNCGITASYLKNMIDFALPRPAGAPELYELDTMRALVGAAVSAWRLSFCYVAPSGIRDVAPRGDSIGVFASWLAYLDNDLITALGDLPDGVRRLDVADGSLFVMAPTPADLDVGVVDAVQRAVTLDPSWRLSPASVP